MKICLYKPFHDVKDTGFSGFVSVHSCCKPDRLKLRCAVSGKIHTPDRSSPLPRERDQTFGGLVVPTIFGPGKRLNEMVKMELLGHGHYGGNLSVD